MKLYPLMIAGLLVLGMSACTQEPSDAASTQAPRLSAEGDVGRSGDAAASGQGLTVGEAWSRAVPPNAPVAAGYLSMANATGADERLLSVRMDAADRVEIHEMTHGGDGTMQMRELTDGLPLPAGQAVDLRPGGLHLMVMGPDSTQWQAGRSIPATLVFEQAGELEVSFEVYAPGEGPAGPARIDGNADAGDGHAGGHGNPEDDDTMGSEHDAHH